MTQAFEVVQPSNSTTLIEFLLDETGSMGHVRKATIDSFNEYINSQRAQPGTCLFTLTQFDARGSDSVRTKYTDVSVQSVPYLTEEVYQPTGMTNLYDAVGARIHALSNRAAAHKDAAKLIVIMTDGQDNTSREYTADTLKALIKQKESEGWTFVFLGANQDAWQVGQTFGMAKGNTMSYSTGDMAGAMGNLSAATTAYRGMVASGALNSTEAYRGFFNPQDDKNGK